MRLEDARSLWGAQGVYLDTASYGLPPRQTVTTLSEAVEEWRTGSGRWEAWSEAVDVSRAAFATIARAGVADIAVGATVSEMAGIVAASLPAGSRVLVPAGDFTSLTWPFAARAELDVAEAALDKLAGAIDGRVDLVAFSLVQSATGKIADTGAIVSAARDAGALVAADVTQACGWLPFSVSDFDFVFCAAYKWLLAPRGVAFMVVDNEHLPSLPPVKAGWFAGEDVHSSYYGLPEKLASTARRLDSSPAWLAWVGAAPSLRLLADIGIEQIHAHNVALARRFTDVLGANDGGSAIVSVPVEGVMPDLEAAGIRVAKRAGGLRASFHVYNDAGDVDALIAALNE